MRMEHYLTFTDHALWEVIVNGDSVIPVAPASAGAEGLEQQGIKEILKQYEQEDIGFNKGIVAMLKHEELKKVHKENKRKNDLKNAKRRHQENQENTNRDDQKGMQQWTHQLLDSLVIQCGERNGDGLRGNAPVDTSTINTLVVQDGIGGYDWSFQVEEGITNFSLIAYTSQGSSSSDSEVHTCSKDCLKSYETLQKQYDQQREALNKYNLEIIGYQIGLESLEAMIVVHEKNEAIYEEDIAFLKYDVQVKDISIKDLKNQLEEALKEKDDLKLKLEKFEESLKNLTKLINSQISAKDKAGLGEGFHAVPLPYTGNYMPSRPDLSFAGLDDSVYKTKVSETETSISKTSKDIVEKPKTVRPSAPIIDEWDTDSDNGSVFRPKSHQTKPKFTKINFVKSGENVKSVNKENTHRQVEYPRKSQSPRDNRRNWNEIMTQKLGNEKPVLNNKGRVIGQREIRPVWNNAQRVNHQNKLTHPHLKRNFVLTAVVTKSGQVPVNIAKQSSPRAATSISTARTVNTAAPKPKVNDALPTTYSYFKAHSPVKMAFNQKSAAKTNKFNKKVNTARVNNVTTAGPKAVVSAAVGNGEMLLSLQHAGFGDQQEMLLTIPPKTVGHTCLKDLNMLIYKAGSNYQEIDGGFVALEEVLKEGLKFNLFSVSQMRDKKNSVLFIETECLVLSHDFKLLDERGLTCLFAKATIDESNLWHRRLGHINFKTMNKLMRGNLVRELPSKLFEKDHTCVSCQKGKQHKASSMNVSPIPTTRIHKEHPKDQIIRDINSATQTRRMTRISEEHAMMDVKSAFLYGTIKEEVSVCQPLGFEDPWFPNKVYKVYVDDIIFGFTKKSLCTEFEVTPKVSYLHDVKRIFRYLKGQPKLGLWYPRDSPFDLESFYDSDYAGASLDRKSTPGGFGAAGQKNKKDERGIVVRNKARLVAQGYTQEEGIDYDKVLAPVAMIEAIRLFFAYASFMGFIVYQMDVKSAFLYGTIEEEVSVCQPPGYEDPQFSDKVYKVENALYGLHQAPRAWYETLSTYLLENGFRRGTIDRLCLSRRTKRVDGIFISQDKYMANILKKFDFSSVKIASTLIETNKALLKDKEAEDVDVHLYRSMIGSLMYLTSSRLDIMFAVCACARFQVTPKVSHLHAVKRIFRYLKGQPKLGLWYPRDSPFDLEAFSDSDYPGASLNRKSTTRGYQFLGKRLISTEGNTYFHQIVDFLNASTMRYSLTISPTICASYIEQFWAIAKSKIVNNETQVHAKVDGKTIVISESSVRSNLHFNDEDGVTSLTNSEILENLALMGYEIVSDKLTF
ncbi:ribonuclease H-like domain-containing protein [Tanacetum coccineum]